MLVGNRISLTVIFPNSSNVYMRGFSLRDFSLCNFSCHQPFLPVQEYPINFEYFAKSLAASSGCYRIHHRKTSCECGNSACRAEVNIKATLGIVYAKNTVPHVPFRSHEKYYQGECDKNNGLHDLSILISVIS